MAYGISKADHRSEVILTPIYLEYDGQSYQALDRNKKLYLKLFHPDEYIQKYQGEH